jgi:aminoglycoside 6'-N-acetyltransferase
MSGHVHAIQLRPAVAGDSSLLRHWDKQAHTIAAAQNDEWDWKTELARDPEWRELLIAELDGRPVGALLVVDPAEEETHYWGKVPPNLRAIDIWIGEAEDLGKGYGTAMMRLALERCFLVPEVKAVLIDPLRTNARARKFYERLGFRYVEDQSFGQDECAVYRLNREDWEVKAY